MFTITSLIRNEDDHEVLIICDNSKYRITTADCDRLLLEEGSIIPQEILDEIATAESRLSCIQQAFVHLSYGDMSKKRLIEKLLRKYDKILCHDVADLLEERGYLNDFQLAERYAENYYDIRSYGPLRIKQELFNKGFFLDDIERVLLPYTAMDHREKICGLLSRKYTVDELKEPAIRKKAVAWLNRNGYSWHDISDVLNTFYE